MTSFDPEVVRDQREALNRHPVYAALRDIDDLRLFMAHHVFSVWDFMSLIKTLQNVIAPIQVPWTPSENAALCYFINQLCLEEESDQIPIEGGEPLHASHFESYCEAMHEICADASIPSRFIELIRTQGLQAALAAPFVPEPSRRFTQTTFEIIDSGRPHQVAAALALGREAIIPSMFRSFLADMALTPKQAPAFHYYLNRHVHLDEDFHGPLSLRLIDSLCAGDPVKIREAELAAKVALDARLEFWDGVLAALRRRRSAD